MSSVQNVAPAIFSAPFDADALFAELESATSDTFDLCVNAGMVARESLDNGRYVIGDLACHVQKRYGENTVGKFAEALNAPVASVREYRRVCAFWSRAVRPALFAEMPSLSYSLLRTAARFKDTGVALDFLRECVDREWKCEMAGVVASDRLGGNPTPEMFKVLDRSISRDGLQDMGLDLQTDNPSNEFRLVIYQLSGKDLA